MGTWKYAWTKAAQLRRAAGKLAGSEQETALKQAATIDRIWSKYDAAFRKGCAKAGLGSLALSGARWREAVVIRDEARKTAERWALAHGRAA